MLGLAMEPTDATDAFDFAALRASEFSRLDNAGIAYLDYAASALYGPSHARAHGDRLVHGIFGNPHSEHLASRNSAAAQAAASAATLAFFDADPDIHDVCFTANATAAIKLVAESYRFSLRRRLILSADNHNSVNGMREFARRAQAPVSVLALEPELPLDRGSASLRAYEPTSKHRATARVLVRIPAAVQLFRSATRPVTHRRSQGARMRCPGRCGSGRPIRRAQPEGAFRRQIEPDRGERTQE